MISEYEGNLLDARVEAQVNTVNCVGVMGKGLALAFKQKYPEMFEAYRWACTYRQVEIGKMYLVDLGAPVKVTRGLVTPAEGPYRSRFIVNFPTKKHWRDPSQLDWIKAGLADLARLVQAYSIRSIAIPALGCQNGGLAWADVRLLIIEACIPLVGVDVRLYLPQAPKRPREGA